MKTELIMLDTPIIVSDEEINENDYAFNISTKKFGKVDRINNQSIRIFVGDEDCFNEVSSIDTFRKIIAGIEGLPKIDWNGLEEEFGWVDVDDLADKIADDIHERWHVGEEWECTYLGAVQGFKKAQSLNEKKFSLQDMENAFMTGVNYGIYNQGGSQDQRDNIDWDDYQRTLQQPKVFDIVVEMEEATGVRQTPMGRANVPLG